MIKTVKYGKFEFPPWVNTTSFIDAENRSSKSYRSREPRTIWQDLDNNPETEITLHLCPKCLLYSTRSDDVVKHKPFCRIDGPPGVLLWENSQYSIYEVEADNESNKLYLQCLCLLGQLFLETKFICYNVDNFLFYVLFDKLSGYAAGFFSKEKPPSWFEYNLACIIIFPPFQKLGLGNILIGFSYFLTRQAGKIGSPEKPLSKHGRRAYISYWCGEVCRILLNGTGGFKTIDDISKVTGIERDDVVAALEHMGAIKNCTSFIEVNLENVAKFYEENKLPSQFDESCAVIPKKIEEHDPVANGKQEP